MKQLLEIANQWLENGFSVLPINYRSKKPDSKKLPNGHWEEFQNRRPTHTELKQFFPGKLNNIGLIVGNGLVIIDFDIQEVFDYWYKLFPVQTYMVKTQRGVHVYIKTKEPAKNYHNDLLDIKAERGYVLIPPSVHPSGYVYQVYKDYPIYETQKLEDVLPKSFTPEPEKICIEVPQYKGGDQDIWDLVDSPLPDNAVQEIRNKIKITDLLTAEPSSRDGRWFVALCPFHDDHTPSFWIDLHRGICGCRTCNIKEMDIINLYARLHQVSNQDAIRELAAKLGN